MKNAKRIIAIVMAAFMLCQGFAVVSAEDGTADTPTDEIVWTYDNSIIATMRVAEEQIFTPEYFPEVNCIKVLVIEKKPCDIGYEYELLLVLDSPLDYHQWKSASETLLIKEGVLHTERNYLVSDYSERSSSIRLTYRSIPIAIGESIVVDIESDNFNSNIFPFYCITFKIDPEVIDESVFTKDYFAEYGIRFWPQGSNSEGAPSEDHWYQAYYDPSEDGFTDETGFDVVNEYLRQVTALANIKGVEKVVLWSEGPWPGDRAIETWFINNEEVASLTVIDDYDHYKGHDVTATVTGVSAGEVTLTCEYYFNRATVEETCEITVYDPADANTDGVIDSLDAAYLLKCDAGVMELIQTGDYHGDVNFDGAKDSLDAALILRRDAGL